MIVDSSALVAIMRDEPEAEAFSAALARSTDSKISAANWLEAAVVVDGAGDPVASRRFDELVRRAELRIEPVTAAEARIARQAYRDFGKGSGSTAGLNFGDCFAYALAVERGESLLFKGDDFGHTDVVAAKLQER